MDDLLRQPQALAEQWEHDLEDAEVRTLVRLVHANREALPTPLADWLRAYEVNVGPVVP